MYNSYYDGAVKSDRPLACSAMTRKEQWWPISTKCFGLAHRGFCLCMCVDITAKYWAVSILLNWIVFAILVIKITSTILVIWVIELDWLLLIWLLIWKLIFKGTIQMDVITNHDNVMLNSCELGAHPKRLEFLLRRESWEVLNDSWKLTKVKVCHFYGIIA